jgi:hypothetical protein
METYQCDYIPAAPRGTGRTHKMLLEVLSLCGDPACKDIVVVFNTQRLSFNTLISFARIASYDDFCKCTDYKEGSITINGTRVRFMSLVQVPSQTRGSSVDRYFEDNSVLDSTMTYAQFLAYHEAKINTKRVFGTLRS